MPLISRVGINIPLPCCQNKIPHFLAAKSYNNLSLLPNDFPWLNTSKHARSTSDKTRLWLPHHFIGPKFNHCTDSHQVKLAFGYYIQISFPHKHSIACFKGLHINKVIHNFCQIQSLLNSSLAPLEDPHINKKSACTSSLSRLLPTHFTNIEDPPSANTIFCYYSPLSTRLDEGSANNNRTHPWAPFLGKVNFSTQKV